MGPCGDEEFLIDLSVRVREGGKEGGNLWLIEMLTHLKTIL